MKNNNEKKKHFQYKKIEDAGMAKQGQDGISKPKRYANKDGIVTQEV